MTDYTATSYANGTTPALNATNMNHMESGIQAAHSELATLVSSMAGIIMAFPSTTIPSGWLKCNGAAVSQSTYSALYTVCGTTFNTGGEGTGNFRLPDLRGVFVRGLDNGKGYDTGRTLSNTPQTDRNKQHEHALYHHTSGCSNPGNTRAGGWSGDTLSQGVAGQMWNVGSTGTEFRPKNIAMVYCIKT